MTSWTNFVRQRCQVMLASGLVRRVRYFSFVPDNAQEDLQQQLKLPWIGVFIDLDNVAPNPSQYTRHKVAARWIRPLLSFARAVGNPVTIQGFMRRHLGGPIRKEKSAAQLWLGRHEAIERDLGRKKLRRRNEMLQILREEGIQIQLVKNVDSQLMHEATQWMEVTANKLQQEYNINIHDLDLLEEDLVAALMVVSEDSDFVPLLQAARSNNFCAISATPMAARQRKNLFLESDLVLVRENEDSVAMVPRANTLIGSTILLNLDQDSLVFGADISLENEEDDVDDGEFEYIRHAKS